MIPGSPAAELVGSDAVSALAGELDALPDTDLVQLDTAWVERFRAIVAIARRAVDVASALLAVAVIIIVGNTIRLEIQSRHSEIEIASALARRCREEPTR